MKTLLLCVVALGMLVGCNRSSPTDPNQNYKTYDLACYDGITRRPVQGLSVILKAADTGNTSGVLITDQNGKVTEDLNTRNNEPTRVYADVSNSGFGNEKYLSWNGLLTVTPIDDAVRGRVYSAEIHMALAGADK